MSQLSMPLSKKERRKNEREMYRKVRRENEREADGTATRERVVIAMEFIMNPGETANNAIAVVLEKMLGREAYYESKWDIQAEAMRRLYGEEPESDSDSTSDTIVIDLSEED